MKKIEADVHSVKTYLNTLRGEMVTEVKKSIAEEKDSSLASGSQNGKTVVNTDSIVKQATNEMQDRLERKTLLFFTMCRSRQVT